MTQNFSPRDIPMEVDAVDELEVFRKRVADDKEKLEGRATRMAGVKAPAHVLRLAGTRPIRTGVSRRVAASRATLGYHSSLRQLILSANTSGHMDARRYSTDRPVPTTFRKLDAPCVGSGVRVRKEYRAMTSAATR